MIGKIAKGIKSGELSDDLAEKVAGGAGVGDYVKGFAVIIDQVIKLFKD